MIKFQLSGKNLLQLLLGVICVISAAIPAVSKEVTQRFYNVGFFIHEKVQAVVEIERDPKVKLISSDGNGLFIVRVLYRRESSLKTPAVDVGASHFATISSAEDSPVKNTENIKAGVFSFMNKSHKQFFIETRYGLVETYILDYSLKSNRVRKIYSNSVGRIVVRPKLNKRGTYDLEEYRTKNQWKEDSDLGIGEYDSQTGYVKRTLYWNGNQFVPYFPGRSHIRD